MKGVAGPRNHLDRTGRLGIERGLFGVTAQLDHPHDLAHHLHLLALGGRVQDHALDQAAQEAKRLVPQRRVGQRLVQPLDLAAVDLRQVRVQPDRRRRRGRQLLLQRRPAGLQLVQALLQAGRAEAVGDGVDQPRACASPGRARAPCRRGLHRRRGAAG